MLCIMNILLNHNKHIDCYTIYPYFTQNNMQTRSMTKNTTNTPLYVYEVNIDFDEASVCWKSNKKYMGNGEYKYICNQNTNSRNTCKRERLPGYEYCKIHNK